LNNPLYLNVVVHAAALQESRNVGSQLGGIRLTKGSKIG